MAKTKISKKASGDTAYIAKLFLFTILGSLWLKLNHGNSINLPVPLGFIIGIILTSHEHFQIDRKIEYAVLLVAMLIGFVAPFGLYISL